MSHPDAWELESYAPLQVLMSDIGLWLGVDSEGAPRTHEVLEGGSMEPKMVQLRLGYEETGSRHAVFRVTSRLFPGGLTVVIGVLKLPSNGQRRQGDPLDVSVERRADRLVFQLTDVSLNRRLQWTLFEAQSVTV